MTNSSETAHTEKNLESKGISHPIGDLQDDNNSRTKESESFLDLLAESVEENNSKIFSTWYDGKARAIDGYTFRETWNEAGVVAHYLRARHNLKKGDRVILCYNLGLKFFSAFLGCLRAGIVAVPVYPPSPNKNLPKALTKLSKIIEDSDARLVLVDDSVNLTMLRINSLFKPLSKSRSIKFEVHPPKKSLWSTATNAALIEIMQENPITSTDLAFLQYTSGSTGDPKGVMVTFGALNANVRALIAIVQRTFESSGVSVEKYVQLIWLPQYHDLGLVCGMILPFAAGGKCNMFSPIEFIKNPLLWIDLMSRLHVTHSYAPNFAYRLAARKFIEAKKGRSTAKGEEPISNLDLSSVLYLLNAAEPIQLDTKELFQNAFGSYGLSDDWFVAGYGLAESVVGVSDLQEYKLSSFEPTEGQPSVAVGHKKFFPQQGQIAKIVCPTTLQVLRDREVGELWLSGPSITAGYFAKSDLTEQVFNGKLGDDNKLYLRTGDLAFFEEGYLYICGRQKDLIIVNGVNHYPQDIENTVQNDSTAIRPGCVAVFPFDDSGGDGDIEVVFEIRQEFTQDAPDIVNAVRMTIIEEIGVVPTRVVAIKERTILKTTSGKIQRKANRRALHENTQMIICEYNDSPISMRAAPALGNPTDSEGDREKNLDNSDPFEKIMVSFFGSNFDPTKTWDELGLASMMSVSLKDAISDSFPVNLAPDCFDVFCTPEKLKEFVIGSQGNELEVHLPLLATLDQKEVIWFSMKIYQAIGSIGLLFIFSLSILPPWYVGKLFADLDAYFTIHALGTNINVTLAWVPIVVPVWMLSLSLLIIILKWAFVWKYKEGLVSIQSTAYLQWWFVDRAVALWELWVGRCIINTPLIKLFYFLMGAKIHRTASIEAFIREFDLVEIDAGTSLQYQIHCRKFGTWNTKGYPFLRFRRIVIGCHCTVEGMVSLGASIGNNSRIEKLSVVQEGCKVPESAYVDGNPAYAVPRNGDSVNNENQQSSSPLLGCLKLLWLMIEVYSFFGMIFLAQYLWASRLPQNWRYAELLKWSLLIVWCGALSIVTSVILKWVVIGKRRPGPASQSLWRTFADWAVDWHFQIAAGLLLSMTTNSRMWNIILMMHGMDIDMASRAAGIGNFVPSKVDLIKVNKSFISVATYSTKTNNHYHAIKIENSSIGLLVHVSPTGEEELSITGSAVPPMVHVKNSIAPSWQDEPDPEVIIFSPTELILQETLMTLAYLVSFGLIFCTLIPPYELLMSVFKKNSSSTISWIALPTIVCALALQTLCWTMVIAVLQYLTLITSSKNGRPSNETLYSLYGTMTYAYQYYSFLNVFLGSPTFNIIVKLLGVQIEGRALLFPHRMHEYSYITVADRTILDGPHITGHYVVYNDITIGPSKVSGVMHEGAYVANALITDNESGSLRTFVGTHPKQKPSINSLDSTKKVLETEGWKSEEDEINWSLKRNDDSKSDSIC